MAIVGGKPEDRRIAAHLIVKGIEKAIDFYERAFGARVLYRDLLRSGFLKLLVRSS